MKEPSEELLRRNEHIRKLKAFLDKSRQEGREVRIEIKKKRKS